MTDRVVVLGAGYAGTRAITTLEDNVDRDPASDGVTADRVELTWISDQDYHLVLHEVHRVIRNLDAREHVVLPIQDIKGPSTEFVQGQVTGIDTDARQVIFADGEPVDYDYLLVALGSDTAFYGISGLEEHAFTLNGLEDAVAIHEAVSEAAATASTDDPARVVVGGAGLSGIQTAGEISEYRDETGTPIRIILVEALDEIMPGTSPDLQSTVREHLEANEIEVLTGDPITEVGVERIQFDEGDDLDYDVLVWTGGITGREALDGVDVESNHNRVMADATFATSDDRVFAVGDAAIVDGASGEVPPTAQAAWSAARVAARNVVRALDGRGLETWTYRDKGTVLSVGDDAVAHDVIYLPIDTFDSAPARVLKKLIAARWIADVTSWSRALRAWRSL